MDVTLRVTLWCRHVITFDAVDMWKAFPPTDPGRFDRLFLCAEHGPQEIRKGEIVTPPSALEASS